MNLVNYEELTNTKESSFRAPFVKGDLTCTKLNLFSKYPTFHFLFQKSTKNHKSLTYFFENLTRTLRDQNASFASNGALFVSDILSQNPPILGNGFRTFAPDYLKILTRI